MGDHHRALSALQAIDPSAPRETWVRAGMAAKAAGLTLADFTTWSEGGSNFAGVRDCEIAWRSFSDGAIGEATLYRMALDAGWQDPARLPPPTQAVPPSPKPGIDVLGLWQQFEPAPVDHGYIVSKRGRPEGLRIVPAAAAFSIAGQSVAGWLAVPAWSLSGILRTVQFIPPPGGGKKLNLPGATFEDGLFAVGDMTNPERICVVEGVGQAWACHEATHAAAVVCFGAGRMDAIASALRETYPATDLVIVADRGKETQAAAIAGAVNGRWVLLPADKPANYDANDFALEHGSAALSGLLEHAHSPPLRYLLLSGSELSTQPPMKWLIKDILPAEGLAAVYGPSGSGKSFLVLDALQSLAAGQSWFGHRVKSCPVTYCALEGEGGITNRENAYRTRHGTVADNIHYLMQPFSLLAATDVHDLARAVKAARATRGVVVLDTLNRAAPGADENDSKAMGQIIASAKELQVQVGGLVLLVHHTGKDASRGLRGHSSLHAALDAAIEVRRDGDRREWVVAKAKDGRDGTVHPFALEVVELGTDDDGDPITSCVVRPVSDATDIVRRVLPPKSGNQRVVWDALGELFREAGDARPNNAPESLPHGRPCIRVEDAIEKTRSRLVCEPKRQTERTQVAIRGLVEKGLLCHEDGFLWCK